MKKVLLLSVALLGLAATVAMADTMNLGYACRTAANNATAATNDFNTGGAGVCDDGVSYTATKGFVCSFKNTTTMPGWGGCEVRLFIQTQTAPLPDFWAVAAGGCNAGALSCPNIVVDATDCTNMYAAAPTDDQIEANTIRMDVATGRVILDSYHYLNLTQIDLPPPSSAGGYLANNVRMSPGRPDACAGCAEKACIGLESIQYFNHEEFRQIFAPELRSIVTWNGASQVLCLAIDPIKNSTWGKMKALYR